MPELIRPEKSIEDSRTEQVHLLRYEDINGENRLFGGKLVSWIDEVAGSSPNAMPASGSLPLPLIIWNLNIPLFWMN